MLNNCSCAVAFVRAFSLTFVSFRCGWPGVGQKFPTGCSIVCSANDELDACSQETETSVTIPTCGPELFRRELFNLIVIPCSRTQTFPHVLSL